MPPSARLSLAAMSMMLRTTAWAERSRSRCCAPAAGRSPCGLMPSRAASEDHTEEASVAALMSMIAAAASVCTASVSGGGLCHMGTPAARAQNWYPCQSGLSCEAARLIMMKQR
eukprot:3003289-Prymnesium_polylepis.1